jgi:DNA-binding CsgD family transcriptional regulator
MKQRYRKAGTTTRAGVATVHYVHEVSVSNREGTICRLLALGITRKAIEHRLDILPSTLKTHIQRVSGPMHFVNQAQLVAWFLQHKGSFDGAWCASTLHPEGCPCDAPFCLAVRVTRLVGELVAVIPLLDAPLMVVR